MTDNDLLNSIRDTTDNLTTVHELNQSKIINLTENIANKFIKDVNNNWWWESLLKDSHTINYGESDGLKILETLISNNQSVFLFITDDEPGPWNVFEGDFNELLYILNEQRFFEYFIVPEKTDWIVFDTHLNSFIVTGTLLEKAKQII